MVTEPAAPGAVIVPGLVNMHDHLRSFVPGSTASEGASLAQAISAGNARQSVAGPAEYRALTALGAARQVVAGTTTVVDHVYPLHRPGLLDAVVAGHAAVGVRGYVALGIMTRGAPGLTTTVADVVALAERAADALLPREQLFLAPVSVRQNAPADYAEAAAAADRLGLGLYTHVSENAAEVDACLAEHGVRPIGLLDRAGFLRPGTVLVHGVELTDDEIDLLARRGAALVYCPTNHLRFAKGVARVLDLLEAGVAVTLGVDGMESLFHEMRQAVYTQGQAAGDPAALSSGAAYAMATATPSAVLGLPETAGDSVRLATGGPAWQPLVDPRWALVHRAGPAHVRDVVVAGRTVLRDGELVSADVAELAADADSALRALAARSGRRPPAPVGPLP